MTPALEPAELRTLLAQVRELPGLDAAAIDRLADDYARGLAEGERPLSIALVGATGAGKSTLLNALAGRALAVEGADRPTSRKVTVFAPEGAALERFEALGAEVRRYSLRDGTPWAGQVFVDTPDLNSIELAHQTLARRALELSDVAVVVMHRGSVAEAVQADFLAEFARRRRLLFVLTHADQLGPAAQGELKAQVRQLATGRFHVAPDAVEVFGVSATQAKVLTQAGPEFLALLESLRALAAAEAARRVREGNAAAALEGLRGQVRRGLERAAQTGQAVEAALREGLAEARGPLEEDFGRRVEAASVHLRAEVRRHAAARWWGPSAWSMRLSLLGAGGLGAATMVARVNLPAGLAVAATSTALSKLQARTRAAAAEDQVVEEDDGAGEVTGVARQVLSRARAEALVRGVSPEALGLPEVDALAASLRRRRASAWRFTREQAVPETVGRWWKWARFVLLPLVNLPLVLLLLDVGYRACRAYWSGAYLGASFFLNALMVGLAVSGVGALLASMTLAGLARQVLRAGRGSFSRALEQESAERLAAVAGALEAPRAAATRLLAD